MAHTCPECGMICYCNGDIDDILLDREEDQIKCKHYLCCCNGIEEELDFEEMEEI